MHYKLFTLFIALTASPQVFANASFGKLWDKAIELHLDQHLAWLRLGHYKPTLLPSQTSYASEEDGPAFFLSPDGKTNPKAELAATIFAFLQVADTSQDTTTGGETSESVHCRFPARLRWLSAQLGEVFPTPSCKRLAAWKERLNVAHVTLVFASSYFGNPSSAFGHTLLRLDRPDGAPPLANYALNFAANPGNVGPVTYALKGMLGGFRGTYSLFPYFFKEVEYNVVENRALWEYRLALRPEEIAFLLDHVWELGEGSYFDYFFLSENCSYHLLTLLDGARGEASQLAESSSPWVLPVETVRRVAREDGLVLHTAYRPAVLERYFWLRQKLSETGQKLAEQFIATGVAQDVHHLPPTEQARLWETAMEYFRYVHGQQELRGKQDPKFRLAAQRRSELSADLSTADIRSTSPLPAFPPIPPPPEALHEPGKIGIRAGTLLNNRKPFADIFIRPLYHDLLADESGFGMDADLEVLSAAFRMYKNTAIMRQFDVISLRSLPSFDSTIKQYSSRALFGVQAVSTRNCLDCYQLVATANRGVAFKRGASITHLLYILPGLHARAGTSYYYGAWAGIGGEIGYLATFDPTKKILASIDGYAGSPQLRKPLWSSRIEANWTLFPRLELRLAMERRPYLSPECSVGANVYW